MTSYPLNSEQAFALCNDFQYLTGNDFYVDSCAVQISHVAVAPYDDINKHIFIQQFKENEDAQAALELYNGALYNVVIIGKVISDKVQYVYKDLPQYLTETKLGLDWERYTKLQRSVF